MLDIIRNLCAPARRRRKTSAHRGLAVVTTADDSFLAQLASPAVAWPDGP